MLTQTYRYIVTVPECLSYHEDHKAEMDLCIAEQMAEV